MNNVSNFVQTRNVYVAEVFVVTEQDLGQVLSGLMEGLYQVLGAITSFDTKVQDQQKNN